MEEKTSKTISSSSLRKYKILHVIPSLVRGGAETILLSIVKGLSGDDSVFEFRVLTILERGLLAEEFEKAGVTVECIDNPSGAFSTNFIRTYLYIKKYKPDIVHTHLWMGDRCGLVAAWFARIPHRITTLHSFEMGLSRKQLLWNWVCSRLASGIIAVSQSVKRLWTIKRRFPPKKITVIYNSSGFEVPKNVKAPHVCSPHPKLLSLGRISEEKGLIVTIMAVGHLIKEHPTVTFDIYGPSNYGDRYQKELLKYIEDNHLEQTVLFKGATNNPMAVYPKYDILMAMSLWEGFNIAAIEAMSCGLPVIASDIPVHCEVFSGGESALLVPSGNVDAVYDAVKKLISDKRLFALMSVASKERSKDFSRDSMINTYRDYYSGMFMR